MRNSYQTAVEFIAALDKVREETNGVRISYKGTVAGCQTAVICTATATELLQIDGTEHPATVHNSASDWQAEILAAFDASSQSTLH